MICADWCTEKFLEKVLDKWRKMYYNVYCEARKMKIIFPNTKEGIKKFLEIKKKIMLDKQAKLCYNVGTTTERNDAKWQRPQRF